MKKYALFLLILLSFSGNLFSSVTKKDEKNKKKKQIHIKQEVVVTATLNKSPTFDTSVEAHVKNFKQIREKIPYNVGDLFKDIPGVDVSESGPNSVRPVIRGLYDERVLILLNAVKLSEQRSGGNHLLSIDPLQIKRVEVVEGPDSVIYGSNAIGGVINFIPYIPDDYTGKKLCFKSGMDFIFNSVNIGKCERVFFETGKKGIGFRASEIFKDTDNYKTPQFKLKNSFSEYYEGNFSFFKQIGNNKIRTYFYQIQGDFGIPNRTAIESYFKANKHRFFSMKLTHNFNSTFWRNFNLIFSIQKHNRHMHILNPVSNNKNLDLEILLNKKTVEIKDYVSFICGYHNLFTAGTSVFREDADSRRDRFKVDIITGDIENLPIAGVIPPSEREGIGSFIQDKIFVNDKLDLTTGIRYDYIKAKTDYLAGHPVKPTKVSNDTYSGSLGTTYHLTDNLNLVFNVGRAFRAPTLLERFFFGPHQDTVNIGNPELKPETSLNIDFGYKYNSKKVYSTFSLYRNRIDDFIVREKTGEIDPESGMEIETWQNAAVGLLRGFEFSFEYYLSNKLSFYNNLSYVKGRDTKKREYLPDIPPMKINLGIKINDFNFFRKIKGDIELNSRTYLRQNNVAPNEKATPGYTLYNIYLNFNLSKSLKLKAAGENLTNKRYHNHLSRINWIDDGQKRCIKFSLNYFFKNM